MAEHHLFAAIGLVLSVLVGGKPAAAMQDLPPNTRSTVVGFVRDATTKKPVIGASVQLGLGPRGSSATTDDQGRFNLVSPVRGKAYLTIRKPGYATLDGLTRGSEAEVFLDPAKPFMFSCTLMPAADITGRLMDPSTSPIPGLSVRALKEDYSDGQKRFVEVGESRPSSADGEFLIPGLAPGSYLVDIHMARPRVLDLPSRETRTEERDGAGRQEYVTTYYPGVEDISMALPVAVSPGETSDIGGIEILKARPYSVRGAIQAADGEARGEVQLMVTRDRADMHELLARGAIRSNHFLVNGLAPGHYTITAVMVGAVPTETRFGSASVDIQDRDVQDTDLVLDAGISIRGHCRLAGEAENVPFSGITVEFVPVGRMTFPGDPQPVELSEDGSFSEPNVKSGEYFPVVTGIPEGWAVTTIGYKGRDALFSPIAVDRGALDTPIEITLGKTLATVSGTLTDSDGAPMTSADILLLPKEIPERLNPYVLQRTTVDKNGRFFLNRVPPGAYSLVVLTGLEQRLSQDTGLLRRKAADGEQLDLRPNQAASITLRQSR